MARTFRNKNTIPVGWTVRDNGGVYFGSEPATPDFRPVPYRRNYFCCEQAGPRRQWSKTYRARTNHLVRTGRWDDLLRPTRTGGWDSW